MTEIVSGRMGVEAVEPFLAHALAEFGPDRCLSAAIGPVMTLAATYSEWLDFVISLVPGEDERRAVLAGTAERVYNLSSATGGSWS
jgi:L-fuconolactonase